MSTFFKYRYKTKDLKKGLAGITSKSESKSKSRAFKSKSKFLEPKSKSKSKSSKNGLKSGLESKSGLEYYKSAKYNLTSQNHVLVHLLPEKASTHYKLRLRQHNWQLIPKTTKLHSCNLILHYLYAHTTCILAIFYL